MPGTRTAGTVDGSPDYNTISLQWIDAVGDQRGDSVDISLTATDAEIEAAIASMVAASNASLWRITIGNVYEGAKTLGNAVEDVRISVQDNLVFHVKNNLRKSQRIYIPAPIETVFVTNTETPEPDATVVDDMMTATIIMMGVIFNPISLRFTERKEIGSKVNL